MKLRNVFFLAVMLVVGLLFGSCSDLSGNGNPNATSGSGSGSQQNTDSDSYLFHISCFPSNSQGKKIIVRYKDSNGTVLKEDQVGTVPAQPLTASLDVTSHPGVQEDEVCSITVALNNYYDYYTIEITTLNPEKTYTVDRYWKDAISSTPKYAMHPAYCEEIPYETTIASDFTDRPFIVYCMDSVAGKTIKIRFREIENLSGYLYTDMDDLLNNRTYKGTLISTYSNVCTFTADESKNTYYMIIEPFNKGLPASVNLNVMNVTDVTNNAISTLSGFQTCLTSDGTLFAAGETPQDNVGKGLYKLDTTAHTRITVHTFDAAVKKVTVSPWDESKLLVAAGPVLYSVDISSGTVAQVASFGTRNIIEYVIQNNRLVVFTESPYISKQYIFLLEEGGSPVQVLIENVSSGDSAVFKNYTASIWLPGTDIFIWDQCYCRIDASGTTPLFYYGTVPSFGYHFYIYSETPMKIGNEYGEVYSINTTVQPNGKLVENWVTESIDDCLDRNVSFCEQTSSDFYFVSSVSNYQEKKCIVDICSKSDPGTPIKTITFENEEPSNCVQINGKIYVITHGVDYVSNFNTNRIYVHEIVK